MDVIPIPIQIGNLHISKTRFLFPVLFTVEYKVGIAEFYLYMGSDADLLKGVLTRAWKLPKSQIGVDATTFLSRLQNLVKNGKQ